MKEILNSILKIPSQIEPFCGQKYKYIRLEEAICVAEDAVFIIEQLRAENEALKARIADGVRVYAFEAWGEYKCDQYGKPNATLLLDDVAISKAEASGEH